MKAPVRTLCVAITVVLFAASLYACKVPVFRYALERWPADNYRMVAILDGQPSGDAAQAIEAIESLRETNANLEIDIVDLKKLSDAELWQVEGLSDTGDAPLLQVFYPQRDGQRKLCWSGKLTLDHVQAWIDSPLRRQIAGDIQSGVSAVWVVVEGTDEQQNAGLLANLNIALAEAAAKISIPEGVIRRADAAGYLKDNPGASMDDVLRSDIPLRIDFTVHRLNSRDAGELAMRAMIDGFTDSAEAPYVFPVFGRGRMIEPLPLAQFDTASVVGACRYMVGECSCSVKALSPGVDLLLDTDWQSKLGDGIVMVETALAATPTAVAIPAGKPSRSVELSTAQIQSPLPKRSDNLLLGVVVILVIAVAILIAAYARREPKNPIS